MVTVVLFALLLVTSTAAVPASPAPSSTSPLQFPASTFPPLSALDTPMHVTKRNNSTEPIAFDKIIARLKSLMTGLDSSRVDVSRVAQKVVLGVYPGVRTSDLDNLAAETAAYMTT